MTDCTANPTPWPQPQPQDHAWQVPHQLDLGPEPQLETNHYSLSCKQHANIESTTFASPNHSKI